MTFEYPLYTPEELEHALLKARFEQQVPVARLSRATGIAPPLVSAALSGQMSARTRTRLSYWLAAGMPDIEPEPKGMGVVERRKRNECLRLITELHQRWAVLDTIRLGPVNQVGIHRLNKRLVQLDRRLKHELKARYPKITGWLPDRWSYFEWKRHIIAQLGHDIP